MVITQSFYNLPSNQKIDIDIDNLDSRIQKFKKKNLPGDYQKKNNNGVVITQKTI